MNFHFLSESYFIIHISWLVIQPDVWQSNFVPIIRTSKPDSSRHKHGPGRVMMLIDQHFLSVCRWNICWINSIPFLSPHLCRSTQALWTKCRWASSSAASSPCRDPIKIIVHFTWSNTSAETGMTTCIEERSVSRTVKSGSRLDTKIPLLENED